MEKPSRLLVIIRRRQLISGIKHPYNRKLPESAFKLYTNCGWWVVGIDTVYSIRVCRIKRKAWRLFIMANGIDQNGNSFFEPGPIPGVLRNKLTGKYIEARSISTEPAYPSFPEQKKAMTEFPKLNIFRGVGYGGIGFTHSRWFAGIAYSRLRHVFICSCWKSWPEDEYRWRFNIGLKWCYLYVGIMKSA